MTLYSGAGHALIYDTLRQLGRTQEYERHIGRSEALAFTSLLLATLLGGPLTALIGYQATILLGAMSMGVAGIIALFLREQTRAGIALSSTPAPQATIPRSRRSATASAPNPSDPNSASLS